MFRFALLTLVSFGIGLAAIPEVWLTRDAGTPHQPAVQSQPDVTPQMTVVNGQSIVIIPAVKEPEEQFLSTDIPERSKSEQSIRPDPSDKHVL